MNRLTTAALLFSVTCLTAAAPAAPAPAKKAGPSGAAKEAASPAEEPGAEGPTGQEPAKPPAAAPAPDRAELEKSFARTLTEATLVGSFTIEGEDKAPKEEKYVISKVTKLQGDYWLFASRIQFGGKDVTVPLMLPVKWAGDTPVITVTDLGIPGLGTYTARVMIFRDHYAGTWSGADHGGHLWGRIERPAAGTGASGAKDDPATKDNPAAGPARPKSKPSGKPPEPAQSSPGAAAEE